MVGAGQRLLGFTHRADQLGAAMAADVVKGAQTMIAAHDDEQVVQPGLHRNVMAGARHILNQTGKAPAAGKDQTLFTVKPFL